MPGQRLVNKVAIVTGSSQGFGREICCEFHLEGAFLVCADLKPLGDDGAIATHESIQQQGGRAIFVKTDVSVAADVEALVAKTVAEYGRVDILINNAGICTEAEVPQPIATASEDAFDAHVRVNARGTFIASKYVIQQMKKQERHDSGVRGWVVNFGSMASLIGMVGLPGYSASKGAISSLTRTIALDVAKDGIVCNCICPGLSETAMLDAGLRGILAGAPRDSVMASIPVGRFGTPVDIARTAVFLASDDAAWITGVVLPVDGGMTAQ